MRIKKVLLNWLTPTDSVTAANDLTWFTCKRTVVRLNILAIKEPSFSNFVGRSCRQVLNLCVAFSNFHYAKPER